MASQASADQVLCENCQGIRLDDSVLDGFAGESEDGYPVLEFESGRGPERMEVAYYEDLLPNLPGLLQSHQDTQCAFCRYLREAILHANIEVGSQEVSISVQYRWCTGVNRDEENLASMSVTLTSTQGRWEKHLFFKVESNEVRVARWLGINRCPESEVWCPKNIEWVQGLIETTNNVVNSSIIPRGLPTRLIDVGENRACNPRIVHTADLGEQDVIYCALSYCWGSAKDVETQLKTTKESMSEFCLGIPESSMTQVMKDTMEICRALNVRYMWIDALCIIQGDKDDWERESAKMNTVYGNAYLTLCALSSNSTHQTFLDRDSHIIELNFESKTEKSIHGIFQLSLRGSVVESMDMDFFSTDPAADLECVWSKRGWTFQEDMLAPRKLLFGRSMLYFQHDLYIYREDGIILSKWDYKSLSYLVTNNPESTYEEWNDLLHEYGMREFTKQADVLPAISGLARVLSEARQDIYLVGLWRKDILRGVIWHTLRKEMDKAALLRKLASPEIYIAPSWSNLRSRLPTEQGIGAWNFPYQETHVISEVANLEASTCPDGLDPYGRIKSGALRMSARLKPVAEYRYLSSPHHDQMWIIYDEEAYSATCTLDYQGQRYVLPGDRTALLLLSSACCDDEQPYRFLYLSKTEMVSQLVNAGYADNYHGCFCGLGKEQRDNIGVNGILAESDSHLAKYRGANPIPCECCKFNQYTCQDSHDECRTCHHCKRCCTQPRRGVNTHAWGLIVHSTGTPRQFYRVGVFTSRALGPNSVSGTNAFRGLPFEEVEII